MKFTALILAAIATATFVAASPVVSPVADKINEVNKDAFIPPIITKPDGDKCKICKETERDCRGSPWCWVPGTNCGLTCFEDTCRDLPACHNKCGFKC